MLNKNVKNLFHDLLRKPIIIFSEVKYLVSSLYYIFKVQIPNNNVYNIEHQT